MSVALKKISHLLYSIGFSVCQSVVTFLPLSPPVFSALSLKCSAAFLDSFNTDLCPKDPSGVIKCLSEK